MKRSLVISLTVLAMLGAAALANASHRGSCSGCASHKYWPSVTGKFKKADSKSASYKGTRKSDELLGHHGSDTLSGRGGSDILWGDYDATGQPTTQRDRIFGGDGTDFIYGSRGFNNISAGPGNDVISVHYGRGIVDCGPGRDIYHVARKRKNSYKFRNCEKVDLRPESKRGPMKPLR